MNDCKIDLEKAYDKINWDFLEETLVEINFLVLWNMLKWISYNWFGTGS